MIEFLCQRSNELSQNDIKQYHALFKTLFRCDKTENQFQQQFLQGPVSYGFHGLMCVDSEIKGAYSAIPLDFIYQGNILKIALVVDALVHPEYQGKGFLKQILNPLYERMKSEGFHLLYGMPNKKFHPLLTGSLGWMDLGKMKWHIGFPGIHNLIKHTKIIETAYRPFTQKFEQYRFHHHLSINTKYGKAWIQKRGFVPVLTDIENRSPEILPLVFQEVCLNFKRPFLFPLWSDSFSPGISVPGLLQASRTFVAAKALTDTGNEVLHNKALLLTLGDFDVL